ncbi:helix-turn-helix domain-containing protein [Marinobacterium aestuariivivens]|uniref:Helix-turn-helix domain-containing protein n=1 Tax=Marinobacterium aestuariivivens TaxID=1698799 RepID=A0ABW1ZW78_9GAMM
MAERDVIARAIREQNGNLTRVAKQLGIAKSTLYIKLRSTVCDVPEAGAAAHRSMLWCWLRGYYRIFEAVLLPAGRRPAATVASP